MPVVYGITNHFQKNANFYLTIEIDVLHLDRVNYTPISLFKL